MDGGELSCPFGRTALSLRGLISSPGPIDIPDFVKDAVSRLEKKSSQEISVLIRFTMNLFYLLRSLQLMVYRRLLSPGVLFEVFLEGLWARFPATVGLEDAITDRAGVPGLWAALAT
jgi:hypothetical protein